MNERNLQVKEVECSGVNMIACQTEDEEVLVSIKSICENFVVDFQSQLKRIKRDDVLSKGVVKMTIPSSGGEQETNMLLISFLPFFLTGIKSSMVRPELRDRIIEFKLKAKDVLAAAFLPKQYQSADIAAVLAQLQNMQAQLNQNTQSLALLADERREHLTEIATLSYDLKTQVQIHPLLVKRERILYKIMNEVFKEEFCNPETSSLYKKAIEQICTMTIPELKRCIRKLGSQDFTEEFTGNRLFFS